MQPVPFSHAEHMRSYWLQENKDLPGDRAFLEAFAQWLNNEGPAGDGSHPVIDSLLWWTWSTNSGDTGGLIDDKNPTQVRQLCFSIVSDTPFFCWYELLCADIAATRTAGKP